MLGIEDLLSKAFKQKQERKWDTIYVLVDIHDTIIKSDYRNEQRVVEYYPNAIAALKKLSDREDVYLILWSSCKTRVLLEYANIFAQHGIKFNDFNENSDVENTDYAFFDKKPYFNIIIDDKAGFEAEKDWTEILNYLQL